MKNEGVLLKSFARRVGKALSNEQQQLLENNLPPILIGPKAPLSKVGSPSMQVMLEIGCGMGENIINHAFGDKDSIYIGCEPYLNGVANCLKLAKEKNITNILLWPDDVDLIMENIPPHSLTGITILFPDPWHKRRHNKRRIFNTIRLEQMKKALKPGGTIWFASDILDYYLQTCEIVEADSDLQIISNSNNIFPPYYSKTKYHQKAIKEGRVANFLHIQLAK